MPIPGDTLNLSPETSEALGNQLCRVIDDLESDHSEFLGSIDTWWDWYNTRPLQQTRTDPWPNASNVVMPIIKTTADAITARIAGSLHTPKRTWEISSPNETLEATANSLEEFLNTESRSTFDVVTPSYDWAADTTVLGSGVLAVGFAEKHSWRWRPGSRKPQKVLISRGPVTQHVPREQCLWERDRTIAESSVFVRQSLLNQSDLTQRVTTDNWNADAVQDSLSSSGVDGVTGRVLAAKRIEEGQRPGHGYQEPHDIREVWIDWTYADLLTRRPGNTTAPEFADPKDPQVPIVVTLHRHTGKVLRAVAHPYYFDRWPFLDTYFRKLAGRGGSQGIAKMLEHPQRAVTTLVNQSIDAVTLANSLKIATSNPRLKNLRFVPNQPLYVDSLQDILPLNLNQQIIPDIQLINMMIAMGERVSGISDGNLGRETKLGGHPSPATNTLVQLQEGAKVLNASMRGFRKQLGQAGEWITAIYQQFESNPGERLEQRMGPEDAARLREVLVSPEILSFDLHAMSESVNPDVERNNAIMVTQVTSNYYSQVIRLLSGVIENPQLAQFPQTKEAAVRAIEAHTKTYTRVLRASDVDEAEQFALAMRDSRFEDANAIQQFGDSVIGGLNAGGGPGGGQGAPGAPQGAIPGASMADAIAGAGEPAPGPAAQNGSGFVL